MPLTVGDKVPEFAVVDKDRKSVASSDLFADGPTVVNFHLFDFSGDTERG